MQTILAATSITLYAACFCVILRLILNKQPASNFFIGLFFVSLATHIAFLDQQVFEGKALHLEIFNASTLIFCVIAIISFGAILRKLPIENLLVILFPFTCLSIGLSNWMDTSVQKITDPAVIWHIVLSIVAYSLITLAALQSIAVSMQDHLLKHHDFKGLFQYLPPLQTMEMLLFEMIWLGFALLTLSIGSGYFFVEDMFGKSFAHKTILSIIAWLIFAILLFGRHVRGWRGTTATKWTIGGFFMLMLAYFGTKFVLEIILHRV